MNKGNTATHEYIDTITHECTYLMQWLRMPSNPTISDVMQSDPFSSNAAI